MAYKLGNWDSNLDKQIQRQACHEVAGILGLDLAVIE
jgi:hypothetical protein